MDRLCDFFGTPKPLQSGVLPHGLHELIIEFGSLEAKEHTRIDHSQCDAVSANSIAALFPGDRFYQGLDRALWGNGEYVTGRVAVEACRRYSDDASGRFPQVGKGGSNDVKEPMDLRIDRMAPFIERDLADIGLFDGRSAGVNDGCEFSISNGLSDDLLNLFGDRNVDLMNRGKTALFGDGFGCRLGLV